LGKQKRTKNQRCFITAIVIALKVKGNNTEVKEIKKIPGIKRQV
jgi:hypothetical protein